MRINFGLTATPLRSMQGEFIGTVVEWEDKTERIRKEQEEKLLAAANARVKEALDNVTTNVMIADADANIIYLNKSVYEMMKVAEDDIKKQLPQFDVNNLMGVNIDIFHKNPAHQRGILNKLTSTYHGKEQT
eukprot:TRINITY_DN64528_c0_g1_i9.p3 TRINITY_DN64528_c0_g1~~TRINITY_DN64528_c0_g1_i9.p3  ORF type:complete len:132 (-),score=16.13 TRINITY_DN64528_c0_g1_i9:64-459(-)